MYTLIRHKLCGIVYTLLVNNSLNIMKQSFQFHYNKTYFSTIMKERDPSGDALTSR